MHSESKPQAAVSTGSLKVVTDVVCPFCGTLCDDIKVVMDGDHIVDTLNACVIGNEKFKSAQAGHRIMAPMEREDNSTEFGKVSWDYAIEKSGADPGERQETADVWLVVYFLRGAGSRQRAG